MPLEIPPSPPVEDLEDLYENAPCGYLSLLPNGRISKVNATFLNWTGFSADELTGKLIHQFLNVAGRIFFETHVAPLLRMQGFFNEIALDFLTKQGSVLPVIANAVERRGAHGELLFTRLTFFQAAERRKYERRLVEARAAADAAAKRLQDWNATLEKRVTEEVAQRLAAREELAAAHEAGELREQFIAVLGHDLRNPLAAINSGARLLSREQLSERAKNLLGLMQSSALRMAGLIDNIMDFARGRLGGGLALNRSSVEVAPIIESIIAELRASNPDRTIESAYDVTLPIELDSARVGQLVSNLIANALTYGDPTKPVRVWAQLSSDAFTLWVANAGEPIGAEAMKRLFQPFFRGDVRPNQQGLGLGLHITSEIAKAHGGTLTVQSDLDETRFTFRMPRADH